MSFNKKTAILCFASLLLISCNNGSQQEPNDGSIVITSVSPQQTITNGGATFVNLEGDAIELADYQGKKIFLNYWATWCVPCIREIPSLTRAEGLLGDDYVFLFASDESIEEIRAFIDEHGFAGNFIKLNSFFASIGVEGVPSSFLYNENGEEIKGWLGDRQWDSPEVLAELRE